MMRQILATAAAITLAAPAAFAGGIAPPAPEPVVVVPVAPVAQRSFDWTGFYVGLQGGQASADAVPFASWTAPPYELSGNYYGAHAGYLHDFGSVVVGGELRYDNLSDVAITTPVDIGGKSLVAASLRAGYDLGRVLPYATVGYGQFTADDDDKSNGMLYGVGADFAVTDHWRLGVEALRFEFKDFSDSTYEVSGNAVGIRASFSF